MDGLQKKERGKQNPLSASEKRYLSSFIGENYTIGNQLGRSGQRSSAYLLTDCVGRRLALKIPNDPEQVDQWRISQEHANKNKEAYAGDYEGNIFIPKTITVGEIYLIEELAEGAEFTVKVYEKLPRNEQLRLAKDFAHFLNISHQRTITRWTRPVQLMAGKPLSDISGFWAPLLTETQRKNLNQSIIQHQNHDSNPVVLAFNDYRSQNVLYNPQKRQLSVIDFDCVRQQSVMHDFVPYAAASFGMSYRFLSDVVYNYNREPKKIPFDIDTRQVKNLHYLGIIHEMGRCAISRGLKGASSQGSLCQMLKLTDQLNKDMPLPDLSRAFDSYR